MFHQPHIINCYREGNCDDNLDGEPPQGLNYAPCWDSCGANTGKAACSKNGIVYPGSGAGLGSTPFPVNSTAACNATIPANTTSSAPVGPISTTPYPNGTNPGGPITNYTTTSPAGGVTPYTSSATGAGSASNSPSATASPSVVPYTGMATSMQIGAGAVVGLGGLMAMLAML
jgi:hypothetical protein